MSGNPVLQPVTGKNGSSCDKDDLNSRISDIPHFREEKCSEICGCFLMQQGEPEQDECDHDRQKGEDEHPV